jgi:hypothetical protein
MIQVKAGDKLRIGKQIVMIESVGSQKAKVFFPSGGEQVVRLGVKSTDPLEGTIWEGK